MTPTSTNHAHSGSAGHPVSGAPRARRRGTAVTPEDRLRIVDLAQMGWSQGAIAKEVDRSRKTVCRVAWQDAGHRFDAAAPVAAVKVSAASARQRRESLAEGLLGDVERLRAMLDTRDHRQAMDAAKALTALVSAHAKLAEIDRGRNADYSDVDRWLDMIAPGSAADAEELCLGSPA